MSAPLKLSGPIRVGKLSSAPSNPEQGMIYFDTSSGKYQQYDGTGFVETADFDQLSSTANGKGASLIGIEDANARYTATDAEAALDEVKLLADNTDSSLTSHLNGGVNKHDASELDFEDTAVSGKNVSAGSVEAAITALDDAIGDLTFVPTNYSDPATDSVVAHLQNIDSALASAGGTEFDDASFKIIDSAGDGFGILFDVTASTADRTITTPDANVDLGEVNTSIQQDGSRAFSADQSMGNNKLTNLAEPTADTDAATKAYVDAIKQGLDIKDSVKAASTANIDLTTGGLLTIDGVTLSLDDRVLVKDQSTASENGLYLAKSGSWVRTTDADEDAEVTAGMFTFVEEGTSQADTGWVLTTNDPITVDTTGLSFSQFSGAGQITAGDGLTKSGNTLNVNPDNSTIDINTDQVRVAPGGITDSEINASAAIDATKIADGSVSNTEFQHLDGVTSGIQTQLDAKLENLSEDTTPSLGGDLTLGSNTLIHDADGMKRGSSASNFLEEEYIHSISLSASQSGTVISDLTFAHASFEGMEVVYKVKEATSNDIRIGTFRVVTNGTSVVLSDVSTETADTGISFDAQINGSNIEITYSSGSNGATMRADVKRIKA